MIAWYNFLKYSSQSNVHKFHHTLSYVPDYYEISIAMVTTRWKTK